MTTLYIFLAAGATMLVSLVGIFTTMRALGGWAERNLKYLATFATGVFIVVAYQLVKETFHSSLDISSILGIIAFGAILGFLIDKVMPDSHHHHDNNERPDAHTKAGAHRIIISDSLHNITDGFLIVPAFLIDIRLGILTTIGIMVHEVAQEISEFFVLRSAGYTTKQALTINFATAATVLLGAGGALFIANISEDLISVLLAIAAGIIIFTIFKDLIPYSFNAALREKTYFKHLAAALAGAAIITGVSIITADTHIHSGDDHHHEHEREEEHHDNYGNHSEDGHADEHDDDHHHDDEDSH